MSDQPFEGKGRSGSSFQGKRGHRKKYGCTMTGMDKVRAVLSKPDRGEYRGENKRKNDASKRSKKKRGSTTEKVQSVTKFIK